MTQELAQQLVEQYAYFRAFDCSFCKTRTFIGINRGCYLEIDGNSKITGAEIVAERQSRNDISVAEVSCDKCGCVSGWTEVEYATNSPKTS